MGNRTYRCGFGLPPRTAQPCCTASAGFLSHWTWRHVPDVSRIFGDRKEASRKTPEAAVAQTGVRFLIEQAEPVEILILHGFLRDRIGQKIHTLLASERPTRNSIER